MTGDAASASEPGTTPWRALALLAGYRLAVALLACAAAWGGWTWSSLGEREPALFSGTAGAYLVIGLTAAAAVVMRRPRPSTQLHLGLLADLAALILLAYASGGARSGLGVLLIVPLVGGGSLLQPERAVVYAALASLGMLASEAWAWLEGLPPGPGFTQAGLLGVGCFAAAGGASLLARRARASEALAVQRGIDLADMRQLTEYVVQRMQTGIVVVDGADRIRLLNDSARHLLGLSSEEALHGASLAERIPVLGKALERWRQRPDLAPEPFQAHPTGPKVQPRIAALGGRPGSGLLIFLEDLAATAQQAQQMKLASLGRLTASIAHEIRNPLGAIAHAGQLLAESPHLPEDDRRLTEIIREHSRRMNAIVENVLQLSRRRPARPRTLALGPWLERFAEEFCATEGLERRHLRVRVAPAGTLVRADPTQLHQVLWNLCRNGVRYSLRARGVPELELRGGLEEGSPSPYLEVLDRGPGVPPEQQAHLFEPFFTTEQGGTGLGLYLARELCEANQARLSYVPDPAGGRFRITFADPRRRQVA